MANPNDFSPQELSCIETVKKAPEWEKESVFKKACAIIWNKTRIALLATTLGLTAPVMAENNTETQQARQESILNIYNNDFLVGIDPDDVGDFKDEFLWLPIELRQLYLDFYLEWKKYLKSPKDLDDFKRKISTLIVLMRDKRSWAEKHINILFKKVWYLQNTPFWNKLIFLAKEIDKIWELESAKKDQIIQEERKKQQQYEEATKRRQELAKKFKNL